MRREKLVKSLNKQGGNVEDNHRDNKHPTPSGVGFVTFFGDKNRQSNGQGKHGANYLHGCDAIDD